MADKKAALGAKPQPEPYLHRERYAINALLGDATSAQNRPMREYFAHRATAEYLETSNVVFAWQAVHVCLAKGCEALPLPEPIRDYLCDTALALTKAAGEDPSAFQMAALNAMRFAGAGGKKNAKDYARLEGQRRLLQVYATLKHRHKAEIAEGMMAVAVDLDHSGIRKRLTAARKTRDAVHKRLFGPDATREPDHLLPAPQWSDDDVLRLLAGLPEMFWRRARKGG